MFRVTKSNSYMGIVTYGKPEERLHIFTDILPEGKYEVSYKAMSLSLMSNLINILRNKSRDFSVNEAIKDKNILMSSVLEASLSKIELEREEFLSGNSPDPEKLQALNKKIMQLKIMKMVYEKKSEKQKAASSIDAVQEQMLQEPQVKKEGARRSQCYLYLFKKI